MLEVGSATQPVISSRRREIPIKIVAVIVIVLIHSACLSKAVTPDSPAVELSPMPVPHETTMTDPIPISTFTPSPTVVEPGLARGYPCKPPCWRGLIPGQSTRKEADRAMEQLQVEGWAANINSHPQGGYGIFPLSGSMLGGIQVTMEDDRVKMINGDIWFDYPLGAMVDQFGPPEGIYIDKGGTTCSSCEMWKPSREFAWTFPTYLLYPEQGLLFWGWVHPSGAGCLCPEMKLHQFCYYELQPMSEILKDDRVGEMCTYTSALKDVTEKDLMEWHGFGGGY